MKKSACRLQGVGSHAFVLMPKDQNSQTRAVPHGLLQGGVNLLLPPSPLLQPPETI